MRICVTRILFACLGMCSLQTNASADGGTLRAWERSGPYEIAAFTAPTPIIVGTVDISVLVLDPDSGSPLNGATVRVSLSREDRPENAIEQTATAEAATNKLLRAALFEIPEPGRWLVRISVDDARTSAGLRFTFDAAGPPPRWSRLWPWVAWPVPVIVLYGLHQWLVFRKGRHRPEWRNATIPQV